MGASEPSKSTKNAARAGSSTNGLEHVREGHGASAPPRYAVPMTTMQSASDAPSGGSDGYAAMVAPWPTP